MYDDSCTSKPGTVSCKLFTEFYTILNNNLISSKIGHSKCVLHISLANQKLTSLIIVIQDTILKTNADFVKAVVPSDFVFPSENVSVSDAGKIRHVGD